MNRSAAGEDPVFVRALRGAGGRRRRALAGRVRASGCLVSPGRPAGAGGAGEEFELGGARPGALDELVDGGRLLRVTAARGLEHRVGPRFGLGEWEAAAGGEQEQLVSVAGPGA